MAAQGGLTLTQPPPALLMAACVDDVQRLITSCPAFKRAVVQGASAEDLLQEVWVQLLRRQRMETAWDPERGSGSIGGYVWLVTRWAVQDWRKSKATRQAARTHALEQPMPSAGELDDALRAVLDDYELDGDECALLLDLVAGKHSTRSTRARRLLVKVFGRDR